MTPPPEESDAPASGTGKAVAIIVASALITALLAVVALRTLSDSSSDTTPVEAIEGVETFVVESKSHTEDPVTYAQVPPVGGDHAPRWQNCGFYEEAIRTEQGVHSLEHGAVWITYDPDLSADQLEQLRTLSEEEFVLISPWVDGDLPAPIVLSAWGAQQSFETLPDPAVSIFLNTYRQAGFLAGTRRALYQWRFRTAVNARILVAAAGAAMLAAIFVGAGWGAAQQRSNESVEPDPVSIGFAYDMSTHHMQAVELAELVSERTDDPEIRLLARDVALTQQAQIGQMRGWLDAWGLQPTSTAPQMEWMGMSPPMPGLASDEEIESLQNAMGIEADRLFLELMIPHHQGGVHMAEAASTSAGVSYVAAAATSMARAQQSEIEALQAKLDELGPP